ncbi:FAD dependent oxidoreductase [Dictyocaulus viviparus]|uniref:FAD dependent oxidoreductase n=1 Tax=Dictyocaulus viviparus TaxID=29172 RepID=A0A0D8XKY3_DICVI|nr:FAD dependent oxidoreductase [Dictyocaulus viviparus]
MSLTRIAFAKRSSSIEAVRRQSTYDVFALIMGSGVAGSSVAYHLTKRNIKDVLLLEKQEIATPSGTSFHSPGLVSASHPAHRYKPILAYSVELYSKLQEETNEILNFERNGTIRLATNPTRLQEFKRYVARDYYKEGDICKTTLLGPNEIAKLVPIIDTKQVLGALYTTNDGMISASGLNRALVKGAKAGGAQIVNSTPISIRYDKVLNCRTEVIGNVELANGSLVSTRNLLNAGGIWANDIARMSGHELPMVLGALYTTNDGMISASGLNRALVKGAKAGGAQIVNSTPISIRYDKDRGHWNVELANGSLVSTRNLLNAGGIWANDIARMSGHELPMVIAEHQYAFLTNEEPKDSDIGVYKMEPSSSTDFIKTTSERRSDLKFKRPDSVPPDTPAIIDHDSTFYIRKFGDKYIFGGFEPIEKVTFREDWYRNGVPTEGSLVVTPDFSRLEKGSLVVTPDFSRLESAYQRACELAPSITNAQIEAKAALFSMTPDGYPLVGPFDKNYWVSTAFLDGVSSGGGIGKYISDWMVDGEPPLELFDTDASRYDRWATRQFIVDKSRETYSMFYNWSYTNRLGARPTDRVSGVYGRLKRDKGHFLFRNGWEVPHVFDIDEEGMLSTLSREYEMVTNKCGVIDMSWKGKIEVKGKDADTFMNYAICTQIPSLGRIGSGLMLTRQGRLFAPLKIFHHDNTRSAFIIITEPERESRDIYWLRRAASEKKFDVQIAIVISPQVLSELTKSDMTEEGFPQRSTRLMRLGLVAVVCARSSTSTGQLSYELFHNRADSAKLYEEIIRAGKSHGVVNFGQATMNAMRLEHGYKIWGRELTLDTNPFECGLGDLVDFNKEDFIGRASALGLSKQSFDRRLELLTFDPAENSTVPLEWKNLPFGMEVVRREGQEKRIGQITSGSYSVRLRRPIAFAWIDNDVQRDEILSVDIGLNQRLKATILEKLPHTPIQ